MQFLLPKTPNIKDYFLSLNLIKRSVFVFTVFCFALAGLFFALGAAKAFSPEFSKGIKSGITSPTDFFGRASKSTVANQGAGDSGGAKTVASPLNGVLYTEAEAAVWKARRPMAVMVNNHVLARPQSGLSQADIIYEAVAEGGISRFLAVFHSQVPEKVGPVRSARKYYVDFAKENDAWFAHWGGASTANEANVYDYMRGIYVSSIDAMWAGASAFWRDFSRNVPTEHTGYTSIPKLYDTAYQRYPDQVKGWRDETGSWVFKDDAAEAGRADSQSVSFNFWDLPDFKVTWDYDKTTNAYKRSQGGQLFTDAENEQQIVAKDVIVLFMDEKSIDDGKGHLLYKDLGQGTGMAFIDGKETAINWSRKSVNERTRFLVSTGTTPTSTAGTDLELNRGQIWIEVLPTGTAVTVQ